MFVSRIEIRNVTLQWNNFIFILNFFKIIYRYLLFSELLTNDSSIFIFILKECESNIVIE